MLSHLGVWYKGVTAVLYHLYGLTLCCLFLFIVNTNTIRKLICCVWTLGCMIEADRVSLGGKTNSDESILEYNLCICGFFLALNRCITHEHLSNLPIDFEQKPIVKESLNEQDMMVKSIKITRS